MSSKFPRKGLYAIIDSAAHESYGLKRLLQNIIKESNIPVIQFRFKSMSLIDKQDIIHQALALKSFRDITLIINDDIELLSCVLDNSVSNRYSNTRAQLENDSTQHAPVYTVDGLHLGQKDIAFGMAKKSYPDKIMGLSTHSLEQAKSAEKLQADYIGCGAVYPSKTKLNTISLGIDGLREITENIKIPKVAIGGVSPENVAEIAATGCEMAASISGLIADGRFVGQDLHELFLKAQNG